MVRATQKGEMENPSPEITKVASSVSKSDVKKMASTKHKGLPEKKKVEEAAFLAPLAKVALSAGKGAIKQKAKQVIKQKAVNVAKGAIPQPNRDIHSEGVGRAAIGAGIGAMVGGPVGAAVGGSIGAAMGKKKKVTGGNKVKKKATNFFKAEPKVTSSEGVVAFVKKGLERDKKAKVEKKIKDRKAVPYAALAAEHQPEGELVDEAAPLAAVPAAAAKGVAVAGKVAVKGAAAVGKAVAKGASAVGKATAAGAKTATKLAVKGTKAVGKAAGEGIKAGAKTAGKTVAVAAGDAGASVVKSAGEGAAQRVKQRISGSAVNASYEPELSIVDKMLMEYSPNVTYQDKKKGKLGKSSIYSLRDKDESKKDFRKSHVKDVEDGYVGKGHKPTPGSLKKEEVQIEAKVDTGKDDEGKEDARNTRRYGHVPYNKHGHSVLRRSEHRMRRGDKKRPGHKEVNVETGKVGKEIGETYRVLAKDKDDKGRPAQFSYKDENDAKKFADSIKSKGGKATVARESKETAKLAKRVLKDREPCNECGSVAHVTGQCPKKEHGVTEGVMDIVNRYKKKKEEKKPQKAQDAGARARRVLKRREYQSKVSAIVPAELEDQKVWDRIKKIW